MSKEVIEVFNYIGEKFGIAIDWSQENLIPYLTDLWDRFITYEITIKSIWLFLCCLIFIIDILFVVKYYKAYKKSLNEEADGFFFVEETGPYGEPYIDYRGTFVPSVIILISLSIAALYTFFIAGADLLELLIIPEKFVFELVKSYQEV